MGDLTALNVAVNSYLQLNFPVSASSKVLITKDAMSDAMVVDLFAQVVRGFGGQVEMIECPFVDSPYRSYVPSSFKEIKKFSHWIDFTDQMAIHSSDCKKFISEGGLFLLLPGLSLSQAKIVFCETDPVAIRSEAAKITMLFRNAKKITISSSDGSEVCVNMTRGISLARAKELMAIKGKEVMLHGYALIPVDFESMNGRIFVNGCVWPPNSIRKVKAPFVIDVRNGVIEKISDDGKGSDLKQWFENFNSLAVRKIAHLTLGLIDGVSHSDSLLMNERIKGALTFGFGNTWSGESPTHTDMVLLNCEIFLDGKKK